MKALESTFFDGLNERVSTTPGLIKRIAERLSAASPHAPRQFWPAALHLKHQQAALGMKDYEVRLTLAQRLAC
jgi:hypothetical protein